MIWHHHAECICHLTSTAWSVKRLKGLNTSHMYIQLGPFISKLMTSQSIMWLLGRFSFEKAISHFNQPWYRYIDIICVAYYYIIAIYMIDTNLFLFKCIDDLNILIYFSIPALPLYFVNNATHEQCQHVWKKHSLWGYYSKNPHISPLHTFFMQYGVFSRHMYQVYYDWTNVIFIKVNCSSCWRMHNVVAWCRSSVVSWHIICEELLQICKLGEREVSSKANLGALMNEWLVF